MGHASTGMPRDSVVRSRLTPRSGDATLSVIPIHPMLVIRFLRHPLRLPLGKIRQEVMTP